MRLVWKYWPLVHTWTLNEAGNLAFWAMSFDPAGSPVLACVLGALGWL